MKFKPLILLEGNSVEVCTSVNFLLSGMLSLAIYAHAYELLSSPTYVISYSTRNCTKHWSLTKSVSKLAKLSLASYPRRSEGRGRPWGRENAWYTLFAHVLNFRDISENRILQ